MNTKKTSIENLCKSAIQALDEVQDLKSKTKITEQYSKLILQKVFFLPSRILKKDDQENIYRFLIGSFHFNFLQMPSYTKLCNLYLEQIVLNIQNKWEKIFDYRLQQQKIVFKIFKKTFQLKLTPVTRFFVRHLLHFKNEVDLVYLWCDSSDKNWLRKKTRALKKANPDWTANGTDKSRSADNDELKYSLRSVEKFAPWIHKIYIITDGQKPKWVNEANKKIKIVDLKEMMPHKYLPCFNSNVIESFMFQIKGLSEYFLYACDDMFFGNFVTKDFFFSADGTPYARFNKMPPAYKIIDSPYLQTLVRMSRLYEEQCGKKIFLNSHHNIDAYTKSYFKDLQKTFPEHLKVWRQNQFRTTRDFQRILLLYQALAEKKAILKFQKSKKYLRQDSMFFRLGRKDIAKELKTYQPKLFCINDNEKATDIDRQNIKKLYQKLFPYPSRFEK